MTSEQTTARRARDIAATIVLLIGHALLAYVTYLVVGLSVMATDSCSYRECGNQLWADIGVQAALFGGIVLVIADLVVSILRLTKSQVASFVPLLFCAAQVVLGLAAWGVVSLAGPA